MTNTTQVFLEILWTILPTVFSETAISSIFEPFRLLLLFICLVKVFFLYLYLSIDTVFYFYTKYLFTTGVNSKLAYFIHTYVRGFVATRPPYSDVYHRLCLSLCLHLWCSAIYSSFRNMPQVPSNLITTTQTSAYMYYYY